MRETWVWRLPAEKIIDAAKERLHQEQIADAEAKARQEQMKADMKEDDWWPSLGGHSYYRSVAPELERWIKILGSFKGAEYALDKSDMDFFGLPTEELHVHSCSCGLSHG